jgi:hypothetical protein
MALAGRDVVVVVGVADTGVGGGESSPLHENMTAVIEMMTKRKLFFMVASFFQIGLKEIILNPNHRKRNGVGASELP